MSAEIFQLLDIEKIDKSILKRDFIKINHQHCSEMNNRNQNTELLVWRKTSLYKKRE